MKYHKRKGRVLSALLALVLLCGCGVAAGPASGAVEATLVPRAEKVVEVSNVDELLSAIAPGTTIVLAPGEYDLSAAAVECLAAPEAKDLETILDADAAARRFVHESVGA